MSKIETLATAAATHVADLEAERATVAEQVTRHIAEGHSGMRWAVRGMENLAKIDGLLEVWREAHANATSRHANDEDGLVVMFLTTSMIAHPARALSLVGAQTGSRELDTHRAEGVMQAAAAVLNILTR